MRSKCLNGKKIDNGWTNWVWNARLQGEVKDETEITEITGEITENTKTQKIE